MVLFGGREKREGEGPSSQGEGRERGKKKEKCFRNTVRKGGEKRGHKAVTGGVGEKQKKEGSPKQDQERRKGKKKPRSRKEEKESQRRNNKGKGRGFFLSQEEGERGDYLI